MCKVAEKCNRRTRRGTERSFEKSKIREQWTFFKKGPFPGRFFVYFRSFSIKHHYNCYSKLMGKMSIQYTVLRFKPITFRNCVSSRNQIRAPAQPLCAFWLETLLIITSQSQKLKQINLGTVLGNLHFRPEVVADGTATQMSKCRYSLHVTR